MMDETPEKGDVSETPQKTDEAPLKTEAPVMQPEELELEAPEKTETPGKGDVPEAPVKTDEAPLKTEAPVMQPEK